MTQNVRCWIKVIGSGRNKRQTGIIWIGIFSAMVKIINRLCLILRGPPEKYRCRQSLLLASGGRDTGLTQTRNSGNWSMNLKYTMSRWMFWSSTWTGTRHLIYAGGKKRKIKPGRGWAGPVTHGIKFCSLILPDFLNGAKIKD